MLRTTCPRSHLLTALAGTVLASLTSCAAMRDIAVSYKDAEAHMNPSSVERATAPHGVELSCAGNSYSYLVPVADGGVVVVDTGLDEKGTNLKRAIGDRPVRGVLLTHAHIDHRAAAHQFGDTPVYVGRADVPLLDGSQWPRALAVGTVRALFGDPPMPAKVVPVDDGDVFMLGGTRFEAIAVPGHTPGSTVWKVGRTLFTGDALQSPLGDEVYPAPSIVTEDMHAAYDSMRKLRDVDFDTILDGHYGRLDDAKPAVGRAVQRSHRDLWEHPDMRPVGCVPEAVEMAAKAQQLHDGVEVHAHGGGGVTTAR